MSFRVYKEERALEARLTPGGREDRFTVYAGRFLGRSLFELNGHYPCMHGEPPVYKGDYKRLLESS